MKQKDYFNFRNLDIWTNSIEMSRLIYKTTKRFPRHEIYSLTNQLTRASNSISLNIAKGSGYYSNKMFIKHLNHARGSLFEVVSGLELAHALNYISEREKTTLYKSLEKLHKKINGLISYLLKHDPPTRN